MTSAKTRRRIAAAVSAEAVIYARISFDRTKEAAGVERQEKECRELAANLGLTVTHVYVDNDISATSGRVRPEFERMLNDRPAAVITWAQDRLLRLTADLEKVIDLGVNVYMVTQGTLDLSTPAGRAVARTVAAWSQFETEQKAERQVAANDQRAAKGTPPPSIGYGYRREEGEVVIVPEEALVVREVARRVLAGETMRAIAADLNKREVPSPRRTAGAGRWSGTTLRQMIRRASLAGLRVHLGKVVGRGTWPAIITEDEHERITALLNDPARKAAHTGRAPVHLLSGLLECGLCGGKMKRLPGRVTTTKTGGTKRQPAAYTCVTCHKIRRKQEVLDDVISRLVVARLSEPDAVRLFAMGDPEEVDRLREGIATLDARAANAADMFAAGDIDGAQLTRITERLRGERETAQRALTAALPPALPVDLTGGDVAARWESWPLDTKRAIIRHLLRVKVLPVGPGRARTFDPSWISVEWVSDPA